MEADVKENRTGAEDIRWDLTDLYVGIDDPAIERDIKLTEDRADKLAETYRGRITTLEFGRVV